MPDKLMKLNFNDNRGVAAIEFAILLPVLLIVFYGIYQVSNYVMAIRKADNVANDLAFLISREGCIAHDYPEGTPNGNSCGKIANSQNLVDEDGNPTSAAYTYGVYQGGSAQLTKIFESVTPYLLYPIKYKSSKDVAFSAQLIALPSFQSCATDVDRTTIRVMWLFNYPPNSSVGSVGSAGPCTSALCPTACNNSKYLSEYTYSGTGEFTAKNIVFPKQSAVIVNFYMTYKKLLGDDFPGLIGAVLPNDFTKTASYSVRNKTQTSVNNGVTSSYDIYNAMYYCTDCTYTSFLSESEDAIRQTCSKGDLSPKAIPSPWYTVDLTTGKLLPNKTESGFSITPSWVNYYSRGGCNF